MCVERALQTAFNLSRYLRHLDYFLLKNLLKIPKIHVVWHCLFNKLNALTCKNYLHIKRATTVVVLTGSIYAFVFLLYKKEFDIFSAY